MLRGRRIETFGIEKKDDELATLYDILFDDEIICGLKMFTETRRCYRLTKQAFINISYGLSLQNGLSSQGSQPTTHKWKRNEGHTNNNESRSRHDNLNSQKGFNASNVPNNFNNNASNTVSQFFSAYRQPNAKNISMVSQQAKEDSESGRTISLKPQQPTPAQQPKAVDAEFQAMWSQLQQKLPTSPPAPVNPPSSSTVISPQAVSEQTNALKKFLRINAGERPQQPSANVPMQTLQSLPIASCGHKVGTCCAELAAMCQRLGITYPHCSQRVDPITGEVSGILLFADGTELVGPKSSDRSKASERVACLAVKQYPGILATKSAANKATGMKGGPPGVPIPAARVPFPQGLMPMGGPMSAVRGRGIVMAERMISVQVAPQQQLMRPQLPVLPNPPQNWCQQEPKNAAGFPPAFTQPAHPNVPRSNVNPFVPLQAQTAAMRTSDGKLPQTNIPPPNMISESSAPDVIRPVPKSPKKNQPPSTSSDQPSRQHRGRRGRIAAKFSTPLQN
ncbi:hypothetical protein GE061_008192 [Apolygus lucorum]|uniref:Uncharacterized protein n=1 Tax=Apolygus lucorum TaxID=248454 RepID=A0A8S9WQE5_APOLU|nr:hypothetical protein GE061_008192 [Apolygus lucorum]